MSLTTRLLPVWVAGLAVVAWGGGLMLLGDSLSGPFSPLQWLSYTVILIFVPLAAVTGFACTARIAFRQGDQAKGRLLAAAPLALVVIAAILAWNYG